MLNFGPLWINVCVALIVSACLSCGSALNEPAMQSHVNDFERLVKQIENEPSATARGELAETLANTIGTTPDSDQISDDLVHDIVRLLRDRDEGVRLWVALALGQLGSRGSVAVPELESALKDAEMRDKQREKQNIVRLSVSSADIIRVALKKITGRTYEQAH
jgi:hypothetical protein